MPPIWFGHWIKVFLNHLIWCQGFFLNLMLENDITTILKKMQWLLGQKIGEKVLNLKLQILLLYLERQVCGLCLFLPCSSGWSYLRTVVSRIQRRVRLGLGVGRLSGWRCCHYPHKFIDNHRLGGQLTRTIGFCQVNSWTRWTHDSFIRWC